MIQERKPAYAGQFYPADPESLRRAVQSYVRERKPLLQARAVVVPHAGYIYSGSVAGAVLSSVKLPRRIILLGPNHTGLGAPLSLFPGASWHTPLGNVPADEKLNRELLENCLELREDDNAHMREHSLEVQIPFLQVLRPDCTISAICVGTAQQEALQSLGRAMAEAARTAGEPVLLLSSSDMTHYESAESAAVKDRLAIDRILEIDAPGLYRTVVENDISMCGFAPTVSVLTACAETGATSGRLIEYTNSGVESGDFQQVVAYAGIVIQ